jgi:hypothetical protein
MDSTTTDNTNINTTDTKKKTSFMDSFQKAVSSFTQETEKIFNDLGQRMDRFSIKDSEPRWKALFGLNENMLADFPCRIINGDRLVQGAFYVSYHHLCFYAPGMGSKFPPIKIIVPFNSITNIQKASRKPSMGNHVPNVVPFNENDPQLKPKIIQIFTNDNLIHQFIFNSSTFQRSWTTLDHAYKTSSTFFEQNTTFGDSPMSAPNTMSPVVYIPSEQSTAVPSAIPSAQSTVIPSEQVTVVRSVIPSEQSTVVYSVIPSEQSTAVPFSIPEKESTFKPMVDSADNMPKSVPNEGYPPV